MLTMRALLAAVILFLAGGSAEAQVPSNLDMTMNGLAVAMVAENYCKMQVDHSKLERALNFNGVYSGDINPGGSLYARLQFQYKSLMHVLQTTPNASCEALRSNMNAGQHIWRGVIIPQS